VSKKPRSRRPAKVPAPAQGSGDLLDTMPNLWTAISAGDLLEAEIETATTLVVPRIAGRMDDAQADKFIADAMVPAAVGRGTPDAAAFLRLLTSLGSPVVKRAASSALAQLTAAGVYPLEWVTKAGKAGPRRAWRLWDVSGDHEWIVVSFSYGDSEHSIVAQIQRAVLPRVFNLAVTEDPEHTVTTVRDNAESYERFDEIGLAEARRRLEEPLKRAEGEGDAATTLRMFWPLAMSRVRRLPEDDLAAVTTDSDRAAAVDEFLATQEAPDAARFWAQILTAFTARIPGESPTAIGPHMLPVILLGHVPAYFTLTPEQRESMEPAVTAWLTWSAQQRDLDPDRLMTALKETLASFDEAYDDPDNELSRRYLADAAVPTANPMKLAEIRLRRLFAVPDQPPRGADFDPADPAARRADAQDQFGGCEPAAGMTSEQFVTAVTRVLDELWSGEPARTWDKARGLVAQGASRHDALHSLVSG
jgi:hypothetical protein